ncbi:hypothetical protein [Teredinibacter turnerae]|uniref:hypothetical protein n=1 Tax=Teredinibacter turnerae TaxID=2426 RepID=UPI0003F5D073|nr:hypothetical protein [Teredinibacter turnerae]
MFKKEVFAAILFLALQGCSSFETENITGNREQEKTYLKYLNREVISTHGLDVTLRIPEKFSPKPIINYEATFNDHPFYVSLATLMSLDTLLTVHAESVEDGSGYLNYSHLERFDIDDIEFYRKDQCLKLDYKTINAMQDLRYVAKMGFDFGLPTYLAQLFKHSDDGNKEIVLTLAKHVDDCSMIDGRFDEFTHEINRLLEINFR